MSKTKLSRKSNQKVINTSKKVNLMRNSGTGLSTIVRPNIKSSAVLGTFFDTATLRKSISKDTSYELPASNSAAVIPAVPQQSRRQNPPAQRQTAVTDFFDNIMSTLANSMPTISAKSKPLGTFMVNNNQDVDMQDKSASLQDDQVKKPANTDKNNTAAAEDSTHVEKSPNALSKHITPSNSDEDEDEITAALSEADKKKQQQVMEEEDVENQNKQKLQMLEQKAQEEALQVMQKHFEKVEEEKREQIQHQQELDEQFDALLFMKSPHELPIYQDNPFQLEDEFWDDSMYQKLVQNEDIPVNPEIAKIQDKIEIEKAKIEEEKVEKDPEYEKAVAAKISEDEDEIVEEIVEPEEVEQSVPQEEEENEEEVDEKVAAKDAKEYNEYIVDIRDPTSENEIEESASETEQKKNKPKEPKQKEFDTIIKNKAVLNNNELRHVKRMVKGEQISRYYEDDEKEKELEEYDKRYPENTKSAENKEGIVSPLEELQPDDNSVFKEYWESINVNLENGGSEEIIKKIFKEATSFLKEKIVIIVEYFIDLQEYIDDEMMYYKSYFNEEKTALMNYLLKKYVSLEKAFHEKYLSVSKELKIEENSEEDEEKKTTLSKRKKKGKGVGKEYNKLVKTDLYYRLTKGYKIRSFGKKPTYRKATHKYGTRSKNRKPDDPRETIPEPIIEPSGESDYAGGKKPKKSKKSKSKQAKKSKSGKNSVHDHYFHFGIVFTGTKFDNEYDYLPANKVISNWDEKVFSKHINFLKTKRKNLVINFLPIS
ncbi:hypothetical protein RFI_08279 [Reticulomyxa filosa]|uniref:Uncharacterized protein n=2 Tax=Reticulomyxa filosa TaxID=46433 RepID=X6NUA5_RETFI|nr:hypothetical protein RFI_08279 [Reticulomyxa filosa]|eukprot:ETO28847.1 hypothetical protein RFI_08279 [Reticulomyxa filosa]